MECSILVVANRDHPLTSRLKPDPGDLDGQDFVLMEDNAPYVIEFNRWLREEEIEISTSIKVQIPYGARQLLLSENYLSILPDFTVKSDIREGLISQLNTEGFSQTQEVQFLTHKSKVFTPQIEGFLREAVSVFKRLSEGQ